MLGNVTRSEDAQCTELYISQLEKGIRSNSKKLFNSLKVMRYVWKVKRMVRKQVFGSEM